jgi:DNA end-binding protein Ku
MAAKKNRSRVRKNGKTRGGNPSSQFWSGTIAFGLVSVPIQMLPAQRNKRVVLRQVDTDGTPLRRRFLCPAEGRIVPATEIVRGFGSESEGYVAVTDKELEALEPEKSREIDLRLFVSRQEISPRLFERSYYLAPDGDSTKAYRLLARVLEKTDRAGIATFVMHDREYVVAIIGEAGILRGQTLRFLDEVLQPADFGLTERATVDRRLSARFAQAIRKDAKDHLDPRELQDEYSQRLKALIERKRKRGKDVVEVHEEPEDADLDATDGEQETDLLDAIRRSLRQRRGGRAAGNGAARSSVKKTGASRGDRSHSPSTATTQARHRPRRLTGRH